MLAVLNERKGTCSTKHALLKALASEQSLPIRLMLGIYEMNARNTQGIGHVLEEQCESLAGSEIAEVLAQIAATPRVPVSSWVDSPKVLAAAQRVLARAGHDPALLEPCGEEFR